MAAGAGDGAELVAELLLHAASCAEDAATRSPTALHEPVKKCRKTHGENAPE